jgi:hypothetical protein
MAALIVFVRDGANCMEFSESEDMLVERFYSKHLKNRTDIERIADKRLYRASDDKLVVEGVTLKSYMDVDEHGDKTVSFILQLPSIVHPAAVIAGMPRAAGAGDALGAFESEIRM